VTSPEDSDPERRERQGDTFTAPSTILNSPLRLKSFGIDSLSELTYLVCNALRQELNAWNYIL
jgi:hypothetical protein